MSSVPVWFVGNRDPSISDVIEDDDGNPVDLSAATSVRFRAREVGSSTLLVDQPVSNTPDATGAVRYDWATADSDPGGALAAPRKLLVWWVVTKAGKSQDVNEAEIEVRAHAPIARYLELEELKLTLSLQGQDYADRELELAIGAAADAIDARYGGPFGAGAPGEARYFTPLDGQTTVSLGWIQAVTEVALDTDGNGEYGAVLVEDVDYALEPAGAGPWKTLRFLRSGIAWDWRYDPFRSPYPWGRDSLRVTGTYGFADTPAGVSVATRIIASRMFRRVREAPFGVLGSGPEGTVMRAGSIALDSDVREAMIPVKKTTPLII